MGPDEKEVKNFVMCPINPDGSFGEPVQLEKLKTVELDGLELGTDSPDNLMYKYSIKYLSGAMSGTLKCNLPRKMSRKKFKKWLMAHEFSRNYAEWLCRFASTYSGEVSYQSLYVKYYFEVVFKNKEFQKSWTK